MQLATPLPGLFIDRARQFERRAACSDPGK